MDTTFTKTQTSTIPTHKGTMLGVLPKLVGQDPYEYLKTVMQTQGDLVKLDFLLQPVYLVSHPDHVQHILRDNHQNYYKPGLLYNAAKKVAANGLVVSTGELWLRQRRMIQPQLHRKQLVYLFEEMCDSITEVLDRWAASADGNTDVLLDDKLAEITINVITRTMFGRNTLPADEITETGHCAIRLIRYIGETMMTGMLPEWIPKPGEAQFRADVEKMRTTVNAIIEKCRAGEAESASLIKMLLGLVDEETNEGMSEQQLFDEVMTIFLAGYETTATALTWLFVALKENPAVLQKLEAEIDQVLGDQAPSFENMHQLGYARQVFMEVLRKYTVVPFLPRTSYEADELGGHHIPANSTVLVFYHGVHHNPEVWQDPEVFDPDRFAPQNMAGRHPFAFVPFSAGPRKCAGDDFAMLEGPLVIAMMLKRFKVHILPGQTFPSRLGATMRPLHGVKVTLERK